MGETMRIGIIGLGRAGAVHLAAAARGQAFMPVAVCDPSPAARDTGAAMGCHPYAQLADMLAAEPLDGVVVCTPPADHAPVALACLGAGLHVLCEKPLTIGLAEAQQLFTAARSAGRRLMVASKFRHVPAMRRARCLLRAGAIGEPRSFELAFCAASSMRERWHAEPARSGGGVIADNGAHAFDLLAYLFGPIARVHATHLGRAQQLAVEDDAGLHLEVGGVLGRVLLSWNAAAPDDRYLTVHGTEGTIEIGWQQSRWRRRDSAWKIFAAPYDKLDAHHRMHQRFVAHAERGAPPWIHRGDSLRSVAAVSAAYRSAASASWETVTVPAPGAPLGSGGRPAVPAAADAAGVA
jgi:predicted dehydrogenase